MIGRRTKNGRLYKYFVRSGGCLVGIFKTDIGKPDLALKKCQELYKKQKSPYVPDYISLAENPQVDCAAIRISQ